MAVPVIALTGYLGAGKTTLLNHVLRRPEARIGLVINDFGEINVDAGLVTGQVDEPASIAGGCICCLPDDGGLDVALEKLSDPKLALDAIIVEASGLAEPAALARIIRFSGVDNVRSGGVVDVIDAVNHFQTVDTDALPPARYNASSLVVVNKLDQLAESDRAALLARVTERVRAVNPGAHIVGASRGRIDPALLYDIAGGAEFGQLSLRDLLVAEDTHADDPHADGHDHDHSHADSVSVIAAGCVDPGAILDLCEDPPAGVYRLKGTFAVRYRSSTRHYVVNLVGASAHIDAAAPGAKPPAALVAIGMGLDRDEVAGRLRAALAPVDGVVPAAGLKRLQRYRRLSV